ncbi:hypothetical protein JM84_1353 [Dokdonia sp. Hel_I_63]|jgi:hypothetical protein|uniref:PID-CTERM protein-sorting domain-containing protein n=1 Tax=unclassified Dokdonia TaxID=2615033 RepID=UPI00020A60AE|nr:MULTISPECIES: hypothetical protein [unclassified Dokdonia]AEE18314.1 hypothetical protein Krodi_0328 [Dokdonia sp. 4H-3-7-5]TVZ22453.1 hypothetical protein JM84_1353 [Dokdonia sp. Hel_I_63]
MTTYKKHIITTLLLLFITVGVQAQITFANDVNDEAPAAPIDGFIAIGLAAGAYLGLKKRAQSEK